MQHVHYRSTGRDRTRHKERAEVEPLPDMLYILYTIYDTKVKTFLFRYFLGFLKARQKAGHFFYSAYTNFSTSVFGLGFHLRRNCT